MCWPWPAVKHARAFIFYNKNMGVRNFNGALYMATGIDNTGLYEGKREAMGIIKALASEVTSFDIFSGIGISAATAFAQAAKSSYDFEQEFRKNMLEVATISTQVSDDMTGFMNQVMDITREIPIKAPEAARALYEIVSAGHDGADGMKILEVAAKSAIGGLTETATAADAITTILNAYNLSAEKASSVSDQLFTTVRLGKTTFGELGSSIAQVAPIAAAYGIGIDEVLAAVASLTKQGTPTAEAMTKIRAAIKGTANELGDAAFQGRTFQEALQLINEKAGGSASKMKEMLGTDEGLAAALALTGKNARSAASDLEELRDSLGATEAAFGKMKDEAGNQMILLSNNIQAALRPMGEAILNEVSGLAKEFNEAFDNGDLNRSLTTLKSLLEVSAAAWGTYKVAVLGAATAHNVHMKYLALSRLATMRHTTVTNLLTKAINGQTAAMLKHPYALVAAAVAALGVALYKLWTYQTNAQKQQEKLNETFKDFAVESAKEERSLSSLFDALKRTNSGTDERKKLIKAVNDQYGQYLPRLLSERSSLDEINEAYTIINTSIKEQIALKIKNATTDEVVTSGLKEQVSAVSDIRKSLAGKFNIGLVDSIVDEIKQTTDEYQKAGSTWEKAWQQAYFNVQRKYTGKIKLGNDFATSMEDYVKSVFDTEQAVAMIEKQYAPFITKIKDLNDNVNETVNETVSEEDTKSITVEDEKILRLRQKLSEQLLALRRQNQQAEIDLMKEGSAKKIAQINLDYDNEIASILAKEKEWKEAQNGNLTQEQTIEIRTALVNSWVKKEKGTTSVDKEELEAENKAMNDYLKTYGNFQEKLLAIKRDYEDKRGKAMTEGERLMLDEEYKRQVADLQTEANKTTNAITRLFSNMKDKTLEELLDLSERGAEALRFLQGSWNDSKGAELGITKEQFDLWSQSPEKLKDISDALSDIQRESDELRPSMDKVMTGIDRFFAAGSDAKKMEEALRLINGGVNEVMGSVNFLSDTFNKLGDSFGGVFGGIADGFNVAMDSVNSAMQGASAAASLGLGGIGTAAGAAIGLVTSLASSIAKIHDSKNEKRIERLQDQIDTLDRSYDNLGRSIEKAYSKDASNLIEQQNKLLEQQKLLIQNQIKEEQSKKKTDDDRIKEWQNQIEDINQTIEDNKQSAVDAIFGEDVQSAIENFSSSLADAWANGTDASKSARDVVRQMMQQMVTESIKSAIKASGQMEQIRKKLQEFYADNVLTGWEQDYIYNMADKLQEELDKQFDWASDLFKNDEEGSSSQQSASSRGFGSEMTHEDAGELSGRFTALQVTGEESKEQLIQISQFSKMLVDSNRECVENIDGLVNLTIISNLHLENIAKYTKTLVSIEKLLVKIEEHSKNL